MIMTLEETSLIISFFLLDMRGASPAETAKAMANATVITT